MILSNILFLILLESATFFMINQNFRSICAYWSFKIKKALDMSFPVLNSCFQISWFLFHLFVAFVHHNRNYQYLYRILTKMMQFLWFSLSWPFQSIDLFMICYFKQTYSSSGKKEISPQTTRALNWLFAH